MLKDTLRFLAGLALASVLYLVALFLAVVFDFSMAGESLKESMAADLKIFLGLLAFTISMSAGARAFFRQIPGPFAWGFSAPVAVGILGTLYLGLIVLENTMLKEPFDREGWVMEKHPISMAWTLVEEEELVGLTRAEVANRFGIVEPRASRPHGIRSDQVRISLASDWCIPGGFSTHVEDWYLDIRYVHDTVAYANVYTPGLDS